MTLDVKCLNVNSLQGSHVMSTSNFILFIYALIDLIYSEKQT